MPNFTNSYPFAKTELFKAVQLSDIFLDSKAFTDIIPLASTSDLEAKYLANKDKKDFDLKIFVAENFEINSIKTIDYQSDTSKPIVQHLNELWPILSRQPSQAKGSLIALPFGYVVPGGRFQEMYYWDSYFTILGLQASGKIDLITGMVNNFAYLIQQFGYIPNGNRSYFLGRSQPPFFALMVEVLAQEKGNEILQKYLDVLETEYQFWMDGKAELSSQNQACKRVVLLADGTVLNRYWDTHDTPRPESYREDVALEKSLEKPLEGFFRHIRAAAESGWDFSSRWFADGQNMSTIHTTDILPVDLNCLLLQLEKTILKAYGLLQNNTKIEEYTSLINQRTKAINFYFYNHSKGFYFDFDFVLNTLTNSYTLAGVFPLFFELASQSQAQKTSEIIEDKFLKQGGVITTLLGTGQQWDAPNGWAPLQYITYKGLSNYGFTALAETLKKRWMQSNEKVYLNTGKMTEKYNVENPNTEAGGGEYPNQDGFGWTNGVYLALASII